MYAEIHNLSRSTHDNEIKGKKQFTDLSKSVKFVSKSLMNCKKIKNYQQFIEQSLIFEWKS